MLGRKDYTRDELDAATKAMTAQLAAYRKLARAAGSDPAAGRALAGFEPLYLNELLLAVDRRFVHRVRMTTGKDTSPLNELELICDALLNNGGVFRTNNVIKYVPEHAVVGLKAGDRINLGVAQVEELTTAVLAEIEQKFC